MTTLTREQAATRFAELPLPSTSDEHWRFTRSARVSTRTGVRHPGEVSDTAETAPMLDLDVAGRAVVTENGIEIVSRARGRDLRAAAGRLPLEADPRRRQVRAREPRALGARPARTRAEGRRARQAALRPGDVERRLALLAHGRDRRGGRALLADRGSLVGRARHASRTRTPSSSCSSSRPRRSSTSRCRTSRRRPGTSAGTRRGSSATPSSTG